MSDRAQRELADAIVRDAVPRYIASRYERVDAFVDRHFTFLGSLALHRRAIGWDLLRAPANLFLAGPALLIKFLAWMADYVGLRRTAGSLARCRIVVKTAVAGEIEWLVATELLEIPHHWRDRTSHRDALAEIILADPRTAAQLEASLATSASADPQFSRRLATAVQDYVGSRTAAAEITTGFIAASVGALMIKQATPGLMTLGSALASMIAQQTAIAAFPLGTALGGLWYSLFPTTAGPELFATTTGCVLLSGALLAAFSGLLTDPLQRRLGLHRIRLERLLSRFGDDLCGEPARAVIMRDHYIARLVDIFDLIALAMRASHV